MANEEEMESFDVSEQDLVVNLYIAHLLLFIIESIIIIQMMLK